LGKEAYSKDLHCYNYEPVKKRKAIQKLSEWQDGKLKIIFYLSYSGKDLFDKELFLQGFDNRK